MTQNHEYHCKDGICVAVRDLRTGEFVPRHGAVGKKATGAVVLRGSGIESIVPPEDASPGQRMHFAVDVDDRTDVLTSSVTAIERPPREVVAKYDATLAADPKDNEFALRRLAERPREIGDQVFLVLDSDGKTHEPVVDSCGRALVARHRVEAHHCRLLDQRLHSAERRRDPRDPDLVDDRARRVEPAADDEGDDATESAHLLAATAWSGWEERPG